jgi:predicted nuclease of predicted toxin-antitoxin system
VKLLFDENVTPGWWQALLDDYPGSAHVRDVGLRGAADARIWASTRTCKASRLCQRTQTSANAAFLRARPPKIVWLDVGNAATAVIIELLQREQPGVLAFAVQRSPPF